MTTSQSLIAAAVAAALAAASPAIAQQSASQGQKQQAGKQQARKAQQGQQQEAAAGAPLIVLIPTQIAASDRLGDGCWARLYDGTNFSGNQLSLVGPVDMPNMRTAFGTDWSGEFDSIAIGPKATVTVYDNENFGDRAQTFNSGQRVADMGEKMGAFEDVRSLRIACAGGAPTAQTEIQQPGAGASAGGSAGGSASAQSRFDALDTNNNGVLSRSEYQQMKK